MSRESAITESISYHVKECRVCGLEVGLGPNIPEDELVEQGFAVIIGEGTVSISEEDAGNWDAEVEFTGEQSDSNPPTVIGNILCADCAEAVHNHPSDSENYRGPLPEKLDDNVGFTDFFISNRALAVIILVIVLLLILLIL